MVAKSHTGGLILNTRWVVFLVFHFFDVAQGGNTYSQIWQYSNYESKKKILKNLLCCKQLW